MKTWVLVSDHPYYAVTDKNGNFSIDNIPPGTYEVVVSQKLISRFSSKNHDLTYFIALEPDSTIE